jgi:ribosome-associated toxin RatA of RatAB toxin-antitoxin module
VVIAASPEALYELTQDYSRRLTWDPFLEEARLIGDDAAGLSVRAWCVARNGFAMETEYVSFNPPKACAVEMTRGPWFLRKFAGSWRFEHAANGTKVSFTYNLLGRPLILTRLLGRVFGRDTSRRLLALKRHVEDVATLP